MEALLRNDFTSHYGLVASATPNIVLTTNATYFEIEDDLHGETQLHFVAGSGMAIYLNPNGYKVTIINYDKFITGLPHMFQHGKKRCDLAVHSDNNEYFLLNELKDRNPLGNFRYKATTQLVVSLELIMAVPSIATFANGHVVKQCCYFNKQSIAPTMISATRAFNRVNSVINNGFKMSNVEIESFGFELYEYSGNQTYSLH